MTIGQTLEGTQRNLYRVLSGEGRIINANFAEAVVMSLDMFIDQDTDIPVLPGNFRNARELLEVRDLEFRSRRREERLKMQREVLMLCTEIIKNPERLQELQDMAPFDCLRSPQVPTCH
jgi:hypothetical protein